MGTGLNHIEQDLPLGLVNTTDALVYLSDITGLDNAQLVSRYPLLGKTKIGDGEIKVEFIKKPFVYENTVLKTMAISVNYVPLTCLYFGFFGSKVRLQPKTAPITIITDAELEELVKLHYDLSERHQQLRNILSGHLSRAEAAELAELQIQSPNFHNHALHLRPILRKKMIMLANIEQTGERQKAERCYQLEEKCNFKPASLSDAEWRELEDLKHYLYQRYYNPYLLLEELN